MAGKSRKKVGRPSILTPKLREEIVELLKMGNYIETACAVVGINKTTYYKWIKKADESTRSTKYSKFRDAVKKAMAISEARDVALITRASSKYPKASMWRLERMYPEKWEKQGHRRQRPCKITWRSPRVSEIERIAIKKVLGITEDESKKSILPLEDDKQ